MLGPLGFAIGKGCRRLQYVFGDFISGRVWSLEQNGQTWTRSSVTTTAGFDLAAIGEDLSGELYVARYSTGIIARIHQTGQP
jgi:hypothetical protein